ncbi:hypothetical protein NT6N_28510 [Oceaniferula spumae]|uniref:Thioredoxin domain-containing protein n=1 Tax=Oceaniferula spumae TaxID=2979115 RepID=A0AAT9FP57_9BACT
MKNYINSTAATLIALGVSLATSSLTLQTAQAQDAAIDKKPAALKVGDAIPANVFEGVTWVQGDPLKALNEPGKIYILECWATWCGPCIAAIPHVNDLHNKFADKGLVIVGMNVWEDGIEKAQNFVKKKGDGMSYRVAFSGGRKSAFADNIMKPAGITGIPRALVVKDGKLILNTHPARIDEALVSSLLDGSFDPVAHFKKQEQEAQAKKEFIAKLRPLQQAGDWAGVKKLAEGLEDDNSSKFSLLLRAAVMTSNWPDLIALRKDVQDGRFGKRLRPSMIDVSVARESKITEGAKSYSDIVLADDQKLEEDAKPRAVVEHHFTKARMMYMSGQTEGAKKELETAKQWLPKISDSRSKTFYDRLILGALKKVDEGSFPTLSGLLR